MTLSGQGSDDVPAGRHGCCESRLRTTSLSSDPIPARHHRVDRNLDLRAYNILLSCSISVHTSRFRIATSRLGGKLPRL